MHNRIWNFDNPECDDLDLFEKLEYRGIDYVDEIREKKWPEEVKDFIYYFSCRGLKFSKRGNHFKVKYNDLKAYFEKYKDDKYGFLFIDGYSEIVTEYDWIENLLEVCEGEETISLVVRQVFDYHF